MKQVYLSFFALVFALFISANVFAHDIEVKNADGVTIYYNYINNRTELEVSFRGSRYDSYSDEYQGNIVIPEEVTTYMSRPRKVTSIGDYAFSECSGLTKVTLNSNAIASKSYSYGYTLGNIFGSQVNEYVLGDDVTSIGSYAFYDCSGLTSVTIGNSVTSIGNYAFQSCSGLTSITIGNSVTSIGYEAFRDCSSLTKVTLNSNAIASKSYSANYTLGNIFGSQVDEYVLGDDVTSIGNSAFYNCSNVTSVTIGNSVTSIGSYAFYNCSNVTSITIPNSVTRE